MEFHFHHHMVFSSFLFTFFKHYVHVVRFRIHFLVYGGTGRVNEAPKRHDIPWTGDGAYAGNRNGSCDRYPETDYDTDRQLDPMEAYP